MIRLKHIFLLLFGFLLAPRLVGQDSIAWKIKDVQFSSSIPKPIARKIKRVLKSSKNASEVKEKSIWLSNYYGQKGYSEFSIDTFDFKDHILNPKVFLGNCYLLDEVNLNGLNESYFEKAGFDKLSKRPQPFFWANLQAQLKFCLEAYQDQGYPFAAFDSLQISYSEPLNDTVHTVIAYQFQPGNLVTIDSVIVLGNIREKPSFVQNLVGIYPGDPYDQTAIDRSRKLLNSSAYFKNARQAEVVFISETKAKVILKMESRKSGKFDLLLGILPPANNTEKIQITGLADLQIVSPLFRAGEVMELRFDKLVGSSQKLHLRYAMPYLFGSPMGVDAEFNLLKQDTTFLTRAVKFGIPYAFSPNLSIRAFIKSKTSNLISVQRYLLDTTLIPPVLDSKDQTYGLGFVFENLDDRFSPTTGWRIKVEGGLGSKKVTRNRKLSENIYQNLLLSLPKKETDIRIEYYQKYSKRMVLLLANSTYWLDQSQYFQNDLNQVGGSRSIRGFNENQFFTNFYTMMTIENRFLLEERSYLFLFSDIAYLEDRPGTVKVMRPWGLGLGLTYETKAGMLSVTYAAGKLDNVPFQPSRGKIHIGLVNQF